MYDIHGAKEGNNGIGDYITTVREYDDIEKFMKAFSLELVFVIGEDGYPNTFGIDDFETE